MLTKQKIKCKCGFEFAEPGEFRNCEAFITIRGKSGIICPECGEAYVDGVSIGKWEDVRLKEKK